MSNASAVAISVIVIALVIGLSFETTSSRLLALKMAQQGYEQVPNPDNKHLPLWVKVK